MKLVDRLEEPQPVGRCLNGDVSHPTIHLSSVRQRTQRNVGRGVPSFLSCIVSLAIDLVLQLDPGDIPSYGAEQGLAGTGLEIQDGRIQNLPPRERLLPLVGVVAWVDIEIVQ